MHLLLVEDDLDLGRSLHQALADAGFTVEWVRRAADADRFIEMHEYDAALLDLSLPDGHGLALLQRWRAAGRALPLIVITASDALDERLNGLDQGADDFLVKPFAVAELVSRIHAVTRRAAQQTAREWRLGVAGGSGPADELVLDPQRRECRRGGVPVELSPREFDILAALARQSGQVLPKHRLAQLLEPLGEPLDFNTIEVHVSKLRRKLGGDTIKTVRGIGYRLQAAPR
jgi:two-component system, OmpR family, response regulator QseB